MAVLHIPNKTMKWHQKPDISARDVFEKPQTVTRQPRDSMSGASDWA